MRLGRRAKLSDKQVARHRTWNSQARTGYKEVIVLGVSEGK